MYLCYLVVLDVMVFNVLNFVTLMKKERFGKTFISDSIALFDYIQYSYTFFTLKETDLSKKNKGRQKRYDVNVRAICGCRQAGRHYTLKKKERFG